MEENTNFNDCSSQRKQRLRTGINSSFKTAEKLLQNQVFGISFNKKILPQRLQTFIAKITMKTCRNRKKKNVFPNSKRKQPD
jgi:hypothetical protein